MKRALGVSLILALFAGAFYVGLGVGTIPVAQLHDFCSRGCVVVAGEDGTIQAEKIGDIRCAPPAPPLQPETRF